MIELLNVTKRYPGGHLALANCDLKIARKEMVFITGRSGAGKSTLLKLIGAIEKPTSGHIKIGEQDISRLRRDTIPFFRLNIGMIFQDHKLLYDRSVLDNVLLPLHIRDIHGAEATQRARAALDKVGLSNRERSRPITLSGGEQQRLCIARAIVGRPTLILADEPTANLDEDYATEIMEILKALNDSGDTIIIATHDQGIIARYGKRRLVLADGSLS
jgi:cell division transport system ATP-binding protein